MAGSSRLMGYCNNEGRGSEGLNEGSGGGDGKEGMDG